MKIFVKNAVIQITKTKEKHDLFFSELLEKQMVDFLKEVKENSTYRGILTLEVNPNSFIKTYKVLLSQFKVIKAAGGIVLDDKNNTLTITRNGYLDLPKGKVEKHESYISAAPREVEEECGISNVKITNKNPITTWHAYFEKEKWKLKKTKWFKMSTEPNQILKPQAEEGITSVEWLGKEVFLKDNIKTFENIKIALELPV